MSFFPVLDPETAAGTGRFSHATGSAELRPEVAGRLHPFLQTRKNGAGRLSAPASQVEFSNSPSRACIGQSRCQRPRRRTIGVRHLRRSNTIGRVETCLPSQPPRLARSTFALILRRDTMFFLKLMLRRSPQPPSCMPSCASRTSPRQHLHHRGNPPLRHQGTWMPSRPLYSRLAAILISPRCGQRPRGQLPSSRRYQLLPHGYSICLVFLKLFERVYAPLPLVCSAR